MFFPLHLFAVQEVNFHSVAGEDSLIFIEEAQPDWLIHHPTMLFLCVQDII